MGVSILISLACAGAGFAQAPSDLSILLGSYHAVPARNTTSYQETNPGLIFTWAEAWNDLDVSIGVFRNSFDGTSALFGVSKAWELSDQTQGRLLLALASYEEEDPIFQPLGQGLVLIPTAQLQWRAFFIQATPLPDPDNTGIIFSFGLNLAWPSAH